MRVWKAGVKPPWSKDGSNGGRLLPCGRLFGARAARGRSKVVDPDRPTARETCGEARVHGVRAPTTGAGIAGRSGGAVGPPWSDDRSRRRAARASILHSGVPRVRQFDVSPPHAHNDWVVRGGVQRVATCLAVLGVLGLGLLPPEHVHVTYTPDGHRSEFVHRHFGAHHRAPDAADTAVEHGDRDHQPRWLSSLFTGPSVNSPVQPVGQLYHEYPPVEPLAEASARSRELIDVSVPDPPWTTSHGLRAPPTRTL
jgi:hypothetical protein